MGQAYRILISQGAVPLWSEFKLATRTAAHAQELVYTDWLSLDAKTLASLRQALMASFQAGFTAGILPRPKSLKAIFFDMDATLIEQETIDELAKEAGVYDQVRAITERAMAGQLDFTTSLRERVAALNGLPVSIIRTVLSRLTLQPGVEQLAQEAERQGLQLFLISGGFVPIAESFAHQLNFSGFHANNLEIVSNTLTGKVSGTIVDGLEKANYVKRICTERQWSFDEIVAIGDGANDAQMLQLTPYGIGFRPKKALWPYLAMSNQTGNHKALITALWDRY